MLQFLRVNKSLSETVECPVISGANALRFFGRRLLYIFLLAYSSIFLAVVIPFDGTYAIGGALIAIVLVRLVNHFMKYFVFSGGKMVVSPAAVELYETGGKGVRVPLDDITYVEVNVLGNLVVRQKFVANAFPIELLSREDKDRVLACFEDMAPRRSARLRKVYDFCDAVLVAFILAMHIRQFIIQAYFIPTGSMEDTLLVGDHLLVEKLTYGPTIPKMLGMDKPVCLKWPWSRAPQRNDIIIFMPPGEDARDFIKRCVAVEGDEFRIQEGHIWINGKKMNEPYVKGGDGITSYFGFPDKKLDGTVPKGMVIAMGDHRKNSSDSRAFGYVPVERIKGRAFVLYWNTKQIFSLDFSRLKLIR
ncbi:MAG: signal peptidase I [Spirochaetes bacterium]|nr:MAG: signal peptidase I [Spirochaetota bacterium]